MRISRNYLPLSCEAQEKTPKTKNGIRTISIPQRLCDTLLEYCEHGGHRKCCLYAAGAPAYVATVSRNEGSTRLNIAKILFNRQRFIGKRDGDLDYAQCGEFAFDRTADDMETKIAYALMQAEHAYTPEQRASFPYEVLPALASL